MDRPTDELAYPATDTRHCGHAGAGHPRRLTFRAKSQQRNQRSPGQSDRDSRRHCERPGREDPGHRPASLWSRPCTRPRHARQGGVLGVPVGSARGIPTVHRDIDHRSRRQPVLRFAADQPHPRPPGSRLFQAGPGVARHRARAGIRPADRTIGAPDRLSSAIGDGRPEADPARLLQPAQIRGVSRQAAARPEGDPAPRQQGNGSGRPLPRRMDRAGRHVDRGIRSAPLRCNAGPEGVSGGDRSRRPDAGLGCRRALAFDPRCRPLHHGRTVQGRTGRRGESPALRGCGDTRGGLAAAAGGRLDPCHRERRAPGRTSRHHGEETWARRSQRANSASPPGRRTGRIDDPAQRHPPSRSNSNAPPSPTSATSSANPRRWKPWASSPAAWRTISTTS
ncbi:hypothetical protein ACVWXQ_007571 [Bradyrhizobium sp. S3.14.4]